MYCFRWRSCATRSCLILLSPIIGSGGCVVRLSSCSTLRLIHKLLEMVPWNSAKVKVQLRLAIQRLRTSQEKKSSVAKAARRDIATLLERGKVETARIKTESIINEDIAIELLEVLELYCEIVSTRFGLVENSNAREPDPGVSEAIIGIVYSAHRTDVKELQFIRESFMHRFGREWSIAVMENHDDRVSKRILNKTMDETPSTALVDAYLTEIARGYKVDWAPAQAALESPPPDSVDAAEFTAIDPESDENDPNTDLEEPQEG
ncbi:DUF292-domain-containing protein [Clavulina sp. PMI_390]|nr:DUF292-domain-containing protein [Clavulina sp. PMI_390]